MKRLYLLFGFNKNNFEWTIFTFRTTKLGYNVWFETKMLKIIEKIWNFDFWSFETCTYSKQLSSSKIQKKYPNWLVNIF